jgi:TatD DNase family protein
VTYARARRLRRIAAAVPIDQLLLETDAPDQPDCESQGQRNEPAKLPRVLVEIAKLRDMAPDDLAAATTANAARLFGFNASSGG